MCGSDGGENGTGSWAERRRVEGRAKQKVAHTFWPIKTLFGN